MNVVYFTPRLYRGQGRVIGLYPSVEGHLVYPWFREAGETPPLIFGGPVWLCFGGLGVQCSGVKVVYFSLGCTGGQPGQGIVVGQYTLWDSVSGSPVCYGADDTCDRRLFQKLVLETGKAHADGGDVEWRYCKLVGGSVVD